MADDINETIEAIGDDVQRFAGKTILLCGGAGFLGRHFIAFFERLNAGNPATALQGDFGRQLHHRRANSST
jgi:hypothetical protein